jgi:hypothetical protein
LTIHELIEALKELPGDWPVYVRGYEGGVNDVVEIEPAHFDRNVNWQYYYGQHEQRHGDETHNGVALTGRNRNQAGVI